MSIDVRLSAEWDRWQQMFAEMGPGMDRAAEQAWDAAAEAYFSNTQDYAHVLTGAMKASGSLVVDGEPGEVSATVRYTVEYAAIENARGGSHAFMALGWEATERQFREALPDAFDSILRRWR